MFVDDNKIKIVEDTNSNIWHLQPLQLDNGNSSVTEVTVSMNGRYMWVVNEKGTLYYCEDGEYEIYEEGPAEYRIYKDKEEYKTIRGVYTEEGFVEGNKLVYVDWKIVTL